MTERKSAEERTSDLLSAAERILERRRRITVSEITREAGIASGTFYLYFPSKSHLEATLIERFIDGYVAHAKTAIAATSDPAVQFDRILESIIEFAASHQAVLRLQVMHAPTSATRDIIARGVDELKHMLGDVLRAARDEGKARVADPEMASALLFHGLEGVLREAITMDRQLQTERLTDTVRAQARLLLDTVSS